LYSILSNCCLLSSILANCRLLPSPANFYPLTTLAPLHVYCVLTNSV
jgi:hypothetical protein